MRTQERLLQVQVQQEHIRLRILYQQVQVVQQYLQQHLLWLLNYQQQRLFMEQLHIVLQ